MVNRFTIKPDYGELNVPLGHSVALGHGDSGTVVTQLFKKQAGLAFDSRRLH